MRKPDDAKPLDNQHTETCVITSKIWSQTLSKEPVAL